MRQLVFVLAVLAGATVVGSPAQAQNYPWCLQSSAFEGGENCGFVTWDQCMATRLGMGGFCAANPDYRAAAGPVPPHGGQKGYSPRPS